jgi:hypothetical protein
VVFANGSSNWAGVFRTPQAGINKIQSKLLSAIIIAGATLFAPAYAQDLQTVIGNTVSGVYTDGTRWDEYHTLMARFMASIQIIQGTTMSRDILSGEIRFAMTMLVLRRMRALRQNASLVVWSLLSILQELWLLGRCGPAIRLA